MRQASKPYLIEIITGLADKGVSFIICGGMAVVYHGVERMTMDLDISLDMTTENIKKFLDAVKELKLVPRAPVPPESLLDKEMIDFFIREKNARVFTFWDSECPYRQIDVFLTEDGSFETLKEYAFEVSVESRTVKIISIGKLLQMKMAISPPRDKDKSDIAALKMIMEREP